MTHLPPGAVTIDGHIIDQATGEAYLTTSGLATVLGVTTSQLRVWSYRYGPGHPVQWPGHDPDQCARLGDGRRQYLRPSTVDAWLYARGRHLAAVSAANLAKARAAKAAS